MRMRQFVWRLLRYRARLFVLLFIVSGSWWAIPLVPGLIMREVFDVLAEGADVQWALWAPDCVDGEPADRAVRNLACVDVGVRDHLAHATHAGLDEYV